jgi:hypothetical protein
MLQRGFDVLLDACAHRDVHRITFRDAPSVLGLREWRAIEERYAYGQLRDLLSTLMERGEIAPGPVELHARVLLAVLSEVAENIANAGDEAAASAARAAGSDLLQRVLGALRAPPPAGG